MHHYKNYNKYLIFLFIFINFLCCADKNKEAYFSYPFENIYNLPSEIVSDLKLQAFDACVDHYKDNLFQKNITFSKSIIDSICRHASIGIPFKRYRLKEGIPLTCGKPAGYYYYDNSFSWIVPIVIDSSTVVEMKYMKAIHKSKTPNFSDNHYRNADSTWKWFGSSIYLNRYYVLKYFSNNFKVFPVFIGFGNGYQDLFTISDHGNEIFGRISPSDDIHKIQDRLIHPENPCSLFVYVESIESLNIPKPYQPIVNLPKGYRDYKKAINSRK